MAVQHEKNSAGVAITQYLSDDPVAQQRPPVILTHGSTHGAWSWEHYAGYLADAGWNVYAFDWLDHGNSMKLPTRRFLSRSILDVAEYELPLVIEEAGGQLPPIVVGHSLGSLAVLAYASKHPVHAVALLCPAVPVQVQLDPTPIPIDFNAPFDVPPFEITGPLFFTTMDETKARESFARLVSESPRMAWEASRWTTWIDLDQVKVPVLTVAAELDALLPPPTTERLARLLPNAEQAVIPGVGHSDLLLKDDEWELGARRLREWFQEIKV